MIGILDYGGGNVASVQNALERIAFPCFVSADPEKLMKAEKLLFPGVGHAKAVMQSLEERGLDDFLRSWKKPLLGICLGMQLLFDFSEEGDVEGLGLLSGKVKAFEKNTVRSIPHIGWNGVNDQFQISNDELQKNDFYFVHSYYCDPTEKEDLWMTTEYDGFAFCSAVRRGNLWGVQFHPEKSGRAGEELLRQFCNT